MKTKVWERPRGNVAKLEKCVVKMATNEFFTRVDAIFIDRKS